MVLKYLKQLPIDSNHINEKLVTKECIIDEIEVRNGTCVKENMFEKGMPPTNSFTLLCVAVSQSSL